ncbi:prepilin-type processing-associated H-X9-DG domain-containing protein [Terrimicrobium sacchariphilum]|uniref:Prepilin-type processing-associated H-X9-DG domain-containing protein n=1 Tax=Terrimicrobium sacchariphilum TaxID=690879 RepID=A0A146G6H3_TERSA|nr:prepilin-type N-terminal cleavage/methylation domain-containing protein [Terrimicrobium sacchariphilum]GAT32537.1 prepilin-type processing-associated H-X9-DG domain-containing protein [Terrimicrobium sacchariphilum]
MPAHFPHRDPRSCRAFSLLELLAGISITALLAALLLPMIVRMKTQAAETRCLANLRTLAQGTLLYQAENGGLLPPNYAFSGGTPEQIWTVELRPYLKIDDKGRTGAGMEQMAKILTCPAISQPADKPSKWWESNYAAGLCFGSDGSPQRIAGRKASATVMFMESKDRLRSMYATPLPWESVPYRHSDAVQMAFLDGHTEARKQADIPKSFDDPFWGAKP